MSPRVVSDQEWAAVLESQWVSGQVPLFDSLQAKWSQIRTDTVALQQQFSQLANSSAEFAGAAASAFVGIIDDLRKTIASMPLVAADVEGIFRSHSRELNALHTEARRAVAIARTNWRLLRSEQQSHAVAVRRRDSISAQIRSLQLHGDPVVQAQVRNLLSERTRADNEVGLRLYSVRRHESAVKQDKKSFDQIWSNERNLDQRTANQLRHVDLRDLRDIGFFERVGRSVTGFFDEFWQNIEDLAVAIAGGDWTRAIWELRDVIESYLVILGAVAMVLAVVVLIVGTGGLAAAVLAGVALATFVLASTVLIIDYGLFTTKSTHPETGRQLTGWDIVSDAVSVALAALSAGAAHKAASVAKPGLTQMVKSSGVRQVAGSFVTNGMAHNSNNRNLGRWAVDKVTGLDVYQTGPATGSVLRNNLHFGGSHALDKALPMAGAGTEKKETIENGVSLLTGWPSKSTLRERDARQRYLLQEIERMKTSRRSLIAPCSVYFIPSQIDRKNERDLVTA